jgi:predicted ATP-dependent protease
LTFEQTYIRIDGDSATLTELVALLSALSGLKIDQGIASTGSVNQFGEVQAVGGINEKIEGFFETCRLQGLTGEQGVVIPASNVTDLCLNDEVTEACAQGQFHVWAVDSVAEAVERLMGVPLGELAGEEFAADSVLGRAAAALDRYQDVARRQGRKRRA